MSGGPRMVLIASPSITTVREQRDICCGLRGNTKNRPVSDTKPTLLNHLPENSGFSAFSYQYIFLIGVAELPIPIKQIEHHSHFPHVTITV